eukprot:TRINITY_DN55348_c0_g1_i1.p1 TRINITY_DN55348_c0_g1~~TRINITY_DN55348_c0_g1_i1.p1  ORF type:complete len:784 (+),score=193.53 TRINITY_DN55348_c0_g1_i1:120-2471(+)
MNSVREEPTGRSAATSPPGGPSDVRYLPVQVLPQAASPVPAGAPLASPQPVAGGMPSPQQHSSSIAAVSQLLSEEAPARCRTVNLREMGRRLNVPYSDLVGSLYEARTDFAVVSSDTFRPRRAQSICPSSHKAHSLLPGDRMGQRSAAVAIGGNDGPYSRYRWPGADGRAVAQSLPLNHLRLPPAGGWAAGRNRGAGAVGNRSQCTTGSPGSMRSGAARRPGSADGPQLLQVPGQSGHAGSFRAGSPGSDGAPLAHTASWLGGGRAHKVIRMNTAAPAAGAIDSLGPHDTVSTQRTESAGDHETPMMAPAHPGEEVPSYLQGITPEEPGMPSQLVRRRASASPMLPPSAASLDMGEVGEAVMIMGCGGQGVIALPPQEPGRTHSPPCRPQRSGSGADDLLGSGLIGAEGEAEEELLPKPKRHVKWLQDPLGGSPIESIVVYELENDLIMDVTYARPAVIWVLTAVTLLCSAYSLWQTEEIISRSDLGVFAAGEVLAWWSEAGQALLFCVIFPCTWLPTREEVRFMRQRRGLLSAVGLGALECAGAWMRGWAVAHSSSARRVPSCLTASLFALVLVGGRALWCKRVLCVEAVTAGVTTLGAALALAAAYHDDHAHVDVSTEVVTAVMGAAASALTVGQVLLIRRLRAAGVTVMLLVTLPRVVATVLHFPLAVACTGGAVGDLFSEAGDYDRWRYLTLLLAGSIAGVGLVHCLAFLHPVTTALVLSAQAVLALPAVVNSGDFLGAGYLSGSVLMLLGAFWGACLSAHLRRNVSVEVSVQEHGEQP